ncbi:MAG: hypothetical protein GEU79_07085 [Acidimicrobiia bacterium]|nr:hypothetical protein [Acidimicrobiia bacterium]
MALRLVEGEGPSELCSTMTEFYAAAFPGAEATGPDTDSIFEGGSGVGRVTCDEGTITLGVAPDAETVRFITDG